MANVPSVDIEKKGLSGLSLPAHCLTAEATVQELGSRPNDGLTHEEAKKRLELYGPNQLDEGEGVSVVKILVRQIANAMMLVKRPTISLLFTLLYDKERGCLIQRCGFCFTGSYPWYGSQLWHSVLD